MQFKKGFVTTDGRFFDSRDDAARHEFAVNMMDILELEDFCVSDSVMQSLREIFRLRASSFARCGEQYYKNNNLELED